MKEGDWSRCLIVARGDSLLEDMFFGRKKLILLAILVGILRMERRSLELGNRTLITEQGKKNSPKGRKTATAGNY